MKKNTSNLINLINSRRMGGVKAETANVLDVCTEVRIYNRYTNALIFSFDDDSPLSMGNFNVEDSGYYLLMGIGLAEFQYVLNLCEFLCLQNSSYKYNFTGYISTKARQLLTVEGDVTNDN